LLKNGIGCEKDLRQAVIWSAKAMDFTDLFSELFTDLFSELLKEARGALESGAMEVLACDINQLCYLLGWGLYWYVYDSMLWDDECNSDAGFQTFGDCCLDFYCTTMELQRESIFTFLLFWNRTVGVKDVGTLIGKMVWEEDQSVWVKRLWKN
jgi:hypothetical protein